MHACYVLGWAWQSVNMDLVLKVPLVPEKSAIDGESEHGVRALWNWGFGN